MYSLPPVMMKLFELTNTPECDAFAMKDSMGRERSEEDRDSLGRVVSISRIDTSRRRRLTTRSRGLA